MKFILVDDNKTFLTSLNFFLKNVQGHEVIASANNGVELLKLNNLSKSDIIIIDIQMPVMGGIDAVKKALWQDPNLKFIATTGYAENVTLSDLLSAGFKGCVLKSNIYNDLLNTCNEILINNRLSFPKNLIL